MEIETNIVFIDTGVFERVNPKQLTNKKDYHLHDSLF